MRKAFVLLALCSLIFACGGDDDKQPAEETKSANSQSASDAETEKGLEMIGADDCTTCHRINEKNIGPAYTEVAEKYEATEKNIDDLATKVIKGGQGVWGQVPMTPHPNLSMDSARTMVKYILSLRNKQ